MPSISGNKTVSTLLPLPSEEQRVAGPSQKNRSVDPAARPCCLIVDDNALNRISMGRIITKLGFDVEFGTDGQNGLNLLRTRIYLFAIFDNQMPTMCGPEAISQWRKEEKENRLPIFAWTTDTDPDTRKRCEDAGMSDFLEKSTYLSKARIRKLLKKHGLVDIS